MEINPTSGRARQVLVGTGVTGAALVLSLAAAVPAVAGNGHGEGNGNGPHGHAYGHTHGHDADPADPATGAPQSGSDEGDDADSPEAAGASADDHGKGQGKGKGKGHGKSGAHGPATPTSHAGGQPTGHNPPGNNGTVFIHDVAGDHSPHNVPHVPCTFYADFFGFDQGQQVTVSFAGQAPTGKGIALGGSWTGTVSDDDAGGAGQDFDLELPFSADTLGVTSLGAPHPKQGYHVKMTVLTNEPGGKKSKVFWIAPCADTPAPPASGGGEETGGAGGTPDTPDTNTQDSGSTGAGGATQSGNTRQS